jgi:hypothetical protein
MVLIKVIAIDLFSVVKWRKVVLINILKIPKNPFGRTW